MGGPRLTNRQVERIRELVRQGWSQPRVAAEIGCDPSTVARLTRDIPRTARTGRPRRDPAVDRRLLVAMASDTPRAALAERFGFRSTGGLRAAVCAIRHRAGASAHG